MKQHNDVVLSVWNRYFSDEQCAGFARGGLNVFWVGNNRSPTNVSRSAFLATSWLLLRLHFKTGSEGLKTLSREFFDRSSAKYWDKGRVVWAYMEYNNRLLKRCRQNHVPTILDVPIGHQRACKEVLAREFQRYNLDCSFLASEKWVRRYEESYALANQIVVGSTFVKTTLVDYGVEDSKIIVNPYGVDVKHWQQCFDQDKKTKDKTIFIYTASVGLRKGIQYLLDAWKMMQPSNAELWICGHNHLPNHPEFTGLPSSVKMLGKQSHQQLANLYSQAHVYVLPSLFEGLARSGIEAMAAGLPPIVTWESGLTDLVTDDYNGWIVPSCDATAISNCIQKILAKPESVFVYGSRAYESAAPYSWENYGNRCVEIARRAMLQTKDLL